MHERRQAYRFRASAGEDRATVTLGGERVSARIMDTSASGLSLKVDVPWPGDIGQKVEVDLNGQVCTLAQVMRIERDGVGAILGLKRLEDRHWEESAHGSAAPIRQMLRRRRRRLPNAEVLFSVLLLIVGMAIGFAVWRPQRRENEPTKQKQPSSTTPASASAPAK